MRLLLLRILRVAPLLPRSPVKGHRFTGIGVGGSSIGEGCNGEGIGFPVVPVAVGSVKDFHAGEFIGSAQIKGDDAVEGIVWSNPVVVLVAGRTGGPADPTFVNPSNVAPSKVLAAEKGTL